MPSETSFDRFRRHFPIPPPPFQWAFFIKRKISRHSRPTAHFSAVIPAPSPPVQTGTKPFPRHSRESGNLERKI
ncbi:hypothetical protein [Neisseria meningitidis]|uniref:hypothetical protein n=1 Tax=Neisseria meningitidis TaxID=487 RepID=UPI000F5287A7|nr:hypothetical protein [Neisseria meningitidis]